VLMTQILEGASCPLRGDIQFARGGHWAVIHDGDPKDMGHPAKEKGLTWDHRSGATGLLAGSQPILKPCEHASRRSEVSDCFELSPRCKWQ